jgi:uncharacterized protein involved in copper resistance
MEAMDHSSRVMEVMDHSSRVMEAMDHSSRVVEAMDHSSRVVEVMDHSSMVGEDADAEWEMVDEDVAKAKARVSQSRPPVPPHSTSHKCLFRYLAVGGCNLAPPKMLPKNFSP